MTQKTLASQGLLSAALEAEVKSQVASSFEVRLGGKEYLLGSMPITPADFAWVNRRTAKGSASFQDDPNNHEGQVLMIIRKARPATVDDSDDVVLDSDAAFTIKDKPVLLRLGVEKVAELFGGLFEQQLEAIADDEEDEEGGVDGAVKN